MVPPRPALRGPAAGPPRRSRAAPKGQAMSPTLDAFLRSWPFDPWLVGALLVPASVYLRGWVILHRRDADRWRAAPLVAFLAGLAAVFLALGSPIEPFAGMILQIHMVQHLLLM